MSSRTRRNLVQGALLARVGAGVVVIAVLVAAYTTARYLKVDSLVVPAAGSVGFVIAWLVAQRRSPGRTRRNLSAGVAVAVAATFGAASIDAYVAYWRLETHAAACEELATSLEVAGRSLRDELEAVEKMRRLIEVGRAERPSLPEPLRWMGVATRIDEQMRQTYADAMERHFARPSVDAVAERLRGASENLFVPTFVLLKQYLAAADPALAEDFWLHGRYAQTWIALRGGDPVVDASSARAELAYYFDLVRRDEVPAVVLDEATVALARARLSRFDPVDQWLGALVDEVADRRLDEALPPGPHNVLYAAASWAEIVAEAPSIRRHLYWRGETPPKAIAPAHRMDAYRVIYGRFESTDELDRTREIMGMAGGLEALPRSCARYVQTFEAAWARLARGASIHAPQTLSEAATLYAILGAPGSPLDRLLEGVFLREGSRSQATVNFDLRLLGPPKPSDTFSQRHGDIYRAHFASLARAAGAASRADPTDAVSSIHADVEETRSAFEKLLAPYDLQGREQLALMLEAVDLP